MDAGQPHARRKRSRKLKVVPQPPVDRSKRRAESRSFWIGLNVLCGGLLLLVAGAVRQVRVPDPEDDSQVLVYREWRLVDAFARGGGPGEVQNGDDFCET